MTGHTTVPPPARSRRLWKWLLALLVAAFLLYVAAAAMLYFGQDGMIFPGAGRRPARPGPVDSGVEQVWLTTGDGLRVEAWFKAGRGRSAESAGPAVMYFHGNSDLIDTRWQVVEPYLVEGVSALAMEYRGYGRCEGRPSQRAIVADAIAFYDWLAERPEVDRERIIFHGLSLGGGVAAALAEQRRPAAIVLECTFTSMEAIAHSYWMPGFLCRHPFRTDRVLPTVGVPVAIFHGRRDDLIPISHGRRLQELTPNSRLIELDCGHDDYHNDWKNIRSFLVGVNLLPDS